MRALNSHVSKYSHQQNSCTVGEAAEIRIYLGLSSSVGSRVCVWSTPSASPQQLVSDSGAWQS